MAIVIGFLVVAAAAVIIRIVFALRDHFSVTAKCRQCGTISQKNNMVSDGLGWFCDDRERRDYWAQSQF